VQVNSIKIRVESAYGLSVMLQYDETLSKFALKINLRRYSEAGGVDCVICMAQVDFEVLQARMVTPCNHFFHTECLTRWMVGPAARGLHSFTLELNLSKSRTHS
jgi:hypothetical protein